MVVGLAQPNLPMEAFQPKRPRGRNCRFCAFVRFLGYREHGVKIDIWRNIPTRDIRRLYDDRRYPDSPDEERMLTTFDMKNFGNYYGGRLSAMYQVHHVITSPQMIGTGVRSAASLKHFSCNR